MSEYQYHEWQAIDRILTPHEQTEVNQLSSHINVSPSRAEVTYHWSDFRHDPKHVLLDFFDAYFYFANWGSLRLMFRFPVGLIDESDIQPYLVDEFISFETFEQYQVLDLDFNPEDGGIWIENEANLSYFTPLRADLLEGDYRLLYLAWLKTAPNASFYDGDVEIRSTDQEPPVPAGLKNLSPALQNFAKVFSIDPLLIQAAAEKSPPLKRGRLVLNYTSLVASLSREECDNFLVRLAEGEPALGLKLRKRLGNIGVSKDPRRPKPSRTFEELLKKAEKLAGEEKKRQEEAALLRHIAEMQSLAAREQQTWLFVEDLLDNGRKIASVYDEATDLLEKLNQLSDFQDSRDIFFKRLHRLADKYATRAALMSRWHRHGWV